MGYSKKQRAEILLQFAEIKTLVNELLDSIPKEDRNHGPLEHEAINWGDLHVFDVSIVVRVGFDESLDESIQVEIEEASPACANLCARVMVALELEYPDDSFEVRTEW